MQKAGLDLKKILFNLEDTENEVIFKLTFSELDEDQNAIGFPPTQKLWWFELLRCEPNCRVLKRIECAMVVKTIKTSAGQGKIYIWLIQRSLSVILIRQEVLSTTSLKQKCICCGKEFLLKDLRSHIDSCFSFPNFERDDASSFKSTLELPPNFIMIDYAKLTKT